MTKETLIYSKIPFDERDFDFLEKEVSAECVKELLKGQVIGKVVHNSLSESKALQFTCFEALTSGVTTSLALDAHGKNLSYALLEMEI